ncbi:hypothetical protein HG15A2_49700 [Adhaeretor mobilis]|uniref:DUF3137 domain-containing protein n=2 Tax=Adhaeretor mobilis TaxID=1930276 RepID=A0A517N3B9_9BACT|nr:hypothetical protein HG15A2_49700 [Adhaeretor mobilis]
MLVGGYFSYQAAKKRRAALSELATKLGWRFTQEKNYEHEQRFRQFRLFTQGSSEYAYNTLSGSLETSFGSLDALMGDYHYETTSTDSDGDTTTHNHYFSYLLVRLPVAGVPGITIRREGLFDQLSSFFGFDDIDFESAEFSKKFHVKCKDKRFAYDLVHPRMMEFLMSRTCPTLDIQQGYLCVNENERIWKPEQFRKHLEWSRQFFEQWPAHLVADLESRAT